MNEKQQQLNITISSNFTNPFLSSSNVPVFSRSINPFLAPVISTVAAESEATKKTQQQQQTNLPNPFTFNVGGEKPFFKSDNSAQGMFPPIKSNAVVVENIPKKYYESGVLNEFFSKFGTVIKTELKMDERYSAIVTFVDQSYAEAATKADIVFEEGTEPVIATLFENKPSLQTSKSTLPTVPQKITRPRQSIVKFKSTLASLANSLRLVSCPDAKTKYDVLDKIDKAIRKGLKRDREKYKAMQGTCVDMCPEKERHMRAYRNQVSPYELTKQHDEQANSASDEMDHAKAVKEYSRSSADQEEPLPHELRPAPVLKITMNYLVRNFMHEELSDRPDWFDFLWNRLRAIRKDITQQNLKCPTSIELLEICARFHILCSHHLCEQEMHVFDSKINLENLTKCLQTLKHMYEDAKVEDIKCENEAEFRCYQILLNLNNGDTLREVMAFSANVRNSSSVKFALEVFSAVHENNYIRFFKLLRKATFLSACLMHPYFQQIRSMALQLMSRCFSVPKNDTSYPLEHLQDVLAFNDVVSTQEFCQQYGFNCDESSVYFNRTAFVQPDENLLRYKSSIVMDKCADDTFAEVVNNGVLPPDHNYIATTSFDADGYYCGTYHELNDVLFKEDVIDIDEAEENENADVLKEAGYNTDPIAADVFPTEKVPFFSTLQSDSHEGPLTDQRFPPQLNPFRSHTNHPVFPTMHTSRTLGSDSNVGLPNTDTTSTNLNPFFRNDNGFQVHGSNKSSTTSATMPPPSTKIPSISFPTLTESTNKIFGSEEDQGFNPEGKSDNPFIQRSTTSFDVFKSKAESRIPIESELPSGNLFGNNSANVGKTDLRAKLLAKRKKEKEEKQDPEFVLAQEDYDDAIRDDEEDGVSVPPMEDHIMFLREDIQYFADQIIDEEINESVHIVLSEVFAEIKEEKLKTDGLCQKVIALFCIQEAREVANEVIQEEHLEINREKAEQYERELKVFTDEFVDDSTQKLLQECCSKVYREETMKLEQSVFENVCEKTQKGTIHYVLLEEVQAVAVETLADFSEERKNHLRHLLDINSRSKLQKLFKRWVKAYKYHMFIKTTLQDFPSHAPLIPSDRIIQNLDPDVSRLLGASPASTYTKFESSTKLKAVWDNCNRKKDESRIKLQRSIQLERYFNEIMLQNESKLNRLSKLKHCYYRLVVRSPTKIENKTWLLSAPTIIHKIQNTYTSDDTNNDCSSELIHQSAVRMRDGCFTHLSVSANYCQTGSDVGKRISCLYGMNGLLFIMEVPNVVSESFWNEEFHTLRNMLTSCKQPKDLQVVVLALSYQKLDSNEVVEKLSMNSLQMSGLLHSYICDTMRTFKLNAFEVDNQIQSLFCWLFEKCSPQTAVTSKPLSTFVEDGMAKLFFQTFHENCLYCHQMDLPSPNPVDVIHFYNNSIWALSKAVLQTDSINPDLGECRVWNEEMALHGMSELITDLLLPDLPDFDSDVWQSCYETCEKYVTIVTENRTPVLANRVNALLRKSYGTGRFPWTEVLVLCIFNKLSSMYSDRRDRKSNFLQVLHYTDDNIDLTVENPLKDHIKDLNETRYVLERSLNYSNTLKRRKYSREHSIRDTIEDANIQLVEIEECLRRRKWSSPRSRQSPQHRAERQQQSADWKRLVNDTNLLFVGINEEKENMQTKPFCKAVTSNEILLPNEIKADLQKQLTNAMSPASPAIHDATNTLEGSVIKCLESIEQTRSQSKRSLEYWRTMLGQ